MNRPARYASSVAFGVFAACAFGSAQAEPTPLASRADSVHRAAMDELGRDRQLRLQERRDLTRTMQDAYRQLAQARQATEALELKRAELERSLADLSQEAEREGRATERQLESLRIAARIPRSVDTTEVDAFASAVAEGLTERLARFEAAMAISVADEEIVDRTGRPTTAKVIRAGPAALAAGTSPAETGLLRRAGGRWLVDGAPLTERELKTLAAAASGDLLALPLDPDGSLSSRGVDRAEEKSWLEAGGVFVWPILCVGLLGFILLIERASYLLRARPEATRIARVIVALSKKELAEARAEVTPARGDLDRVLLAGVQSAGESRDAREAALEAALLAEEPRLERSLTLIAASAGIAPLLGLLGTVTGMIATFDVITQHGTGNPRLLSGGISVALITTQLGLMVAVPLLLGHAWASRAVERRQVLLEEARTALLGLQSPPEAKS